MKAALKWALQNPHVGTAIPGFTTFDQMEDDTAVMADLKLTPAELNALKQGEKLGTAGLYCRQCERVRGPVPPRPRHPGAHARLHVRVRLPQHRPGTRVTVAEALRQLGVCADCGSCTVR